MQPGDYIILAARPSMGKTALALNIAQNVAIRVSRKDEPKKTVAFFSFEMSAELLVQRMLCAEANIDAQLLRVGGETKEEKDNSGLWNRLWIATDRLAEAQIFIDHLSNGTIMDVRSKARRLKEKQGLDLIVIDYLQMMRGTGRSNSDNRQQEVTEISRGLKALARELSVPVLALSQLSRNVEQRTIKRPILSDLRESGSLEQDADIVMFLYREDYYKGQDEEHTYVTELNIAKHRNGPTGTVPLFFHEKYTKFVSLSRRPEDGGR
jgi:replicative DNA helicase